MECNTEIAVQLDPEAASKRYLVRILTLDRKEEKTFCTQPLLEETIKKANQYGCEGCKLLLACDGCELCDNDAYLYYILKGAKFMVAPNAAMWQLPEGTDSYDGLESIDTTTTSIFNQPVAIHAQPCGHAYNAQSQYQQYHRNAQQQQQQQQQEQEQQQPEQQCQSKEHQQRSVRQQHVQRTSPQRYRLCAGHHDQFQQQQQQQQQPQPQQHQQRSPISALPSRLTVVVAPEEQFKNVDVPWHRMPSDIRELLQAGEPLGQRVQALIELIVNELRLVNTHIPIRVLRLIAHRLVMRYPKSFQSTARNNSDLLSIVLNFALAMRQRNNYLNRIQHNGNTSATTTTTAPIPPKMVMPELMTTAFDGGDLSDASEGGGGGGGGAVIWPDILMEECDLSSSAMESATLRHY